MSKKPNGSDDKKLALAIWAGALAVAGNGVVALINGFNSHSLEKTKLQNQLVLNSNQAEADRILAMIRTNDPDSAANNLKFLLETALIDDPQTAEGLINYLRERQPGEGISLPSTSTLAASTSSTIKPAKLMSASEKKKNNSSKLTSAQAEYLLKRYGSEGLRSGEYRPFVTLKYITQDMRSGK